MNADDRDIPSGFIQASYWLKFDDNPSTRDVKDQIIIEVGIHDISGGELEFVCVKDGYIISYHFETTSLSNTNYNFKMEEQRNGDWNLTVDGKHCYTLEYTPPNVYPKVFIRGTETSHNNIPDFTHEFDTMQMKWKNGWYYLQPFFGDDQRTEVEKEFFIDLCGIGIENICHIETGKGVDRNC